MPPPPRMGRLPPPPRPAAPRPAGCLVWLGRFVLTVIVLVAVTVAGGLYACQRQVTKSQEEWAETEKRRAEQSRARRDLPVPFEAFRRGPEAKGAEPEFEKFESDTCWRDTTARRKPMPGMVSVVCTVTVTHYVGSDDPTTSTADFVREARALSLTPDTSVWASPQPVPDMRFPDRVPPPGAGEQTHAFGGSWASSPGWPVAWQKSYAKHAFVVRAAVTAQFRTEREKPRPRPSRTPKGSERAGHCPNGSRSWNCR